MTNKDASGKGSKKEPTPWYKDGLKFECTGCGDCCTGAEGYVWVTNAEIAKLAELLNTTVDDFEYQYVRKIGIRKSLKELPVSFDCVFFDSESRKCQVYEARPQQCQTWPFWDSNLKTRKHWEATCNVCPGSGDWAALSVGRDRKTTVCRQSLKKCPKKKSEQPAILCVPCARDWTQ